MKTKNQNRRGKSITTSPVVSKWKLSPKIRRNIAYVMIGGAVLASYFLTPIPVAVGLTILAVIRFWIVRREEKKEERLAAAVSAFSPQPGAHKA